jgi:hypothetical protein
MPADELIVKVRYGEQEHAADERLDEKTTLAALELLEIVPKGVPGDAQEGEYEQGDEEPEAETESVMR